MHIRHRLLGRALAAVIIIVTITFLIGAWLVLRITYAMPDSDSLKFAPSRMLTMYASEISRAREIVLPLLEEYPGLSVSVGVGREMVWSEGLGYADIAERIRVTPSTRFRIYSLSKPLTASVAASLWEEGALDLDAGIDKYLGSLPDYYVNVTARQLIGHIAGVRHYRDGEWMSFSSSGCSSPSEALDAFINDPLISDPGESYEYSSFGYVLLSAVIDSAWGGGFQECVRETILKPAWMHNTDLELSSSVGPGVVTFYEPAVFGRVMKAVEVDNSCKWGAGAFLSTSDDLARFGLALLGGRIVGDETLEMIFTPIHPSSGEPSNYAFGWGVGASEDGRVYAAHSGGAVGGRGAICLLPDEDIVVVLLANMDGEPLTDEAARVAAVFSKLRL